MKEKVLMDYVVNNKTMALLPAAHMDYYTIALEWNQTLYIKKKPFTLIDEACLRGGSSFEGRRLSAIFKTGLQRKLPIGINTEKNIFVFPTMAPKHFNCQWIFSSHIQSVIRDPSAPKKSILIFNNQQKINLNISHKSLQNQIYRTSHCMLRFSDKWDEPTIS